jgi:hypothetical protein
MTVNIYIVLYTDLQTEISQMNCEVVLRLRIYRRDFCLVDK